MMSALGLACTCRRTADGGSTVIGNDHWRRVAGAARLEDVREAILTGYLDGKPFRPYAPVLEMPGPLDRVLDFGCGLGRNFPYLCSVASHVVGFDLPEMIERCRHELPLPDAVELVSDGSRCAASDSTVFSPILCSSTSNQRSCWQNTYRISRRSLRGCTF